MSRRSRLLPVLALSLLAAGCGRPPVPLDPAARRTAPASPDGASAHPGHPAPAGAPSEPLSVSGRVVLTGSLATREEGRLFLFVEDAHSGGLLLNRAYELSGPEFGTVTDGVRTLEFELGEEDRLGATPTDGHLRLVARVDADGEVLTREDGLATARLPFDAGGPPLEVVLSPEDP